LQQARQSIAAVPSLQERHRLLLEILAAQERTCALLAAEETLLPTPQNNLQCGAAAGIVGRRAPCYNSVWTNAIL